jgi:peptidoglycan-associated lipoprotein
VLRNHGLGANILPYFAFFLRIKMSRLITTSFLSHSSFLSCSSARAGRILSKSAFLGAALALVLSASACSSKNKGGADGEGDGSISESDLDAQREGRFGSGSIPSAEGEGMFRDIHFDYDSTAIDTSAQSDLSYNVDVLDKNPGVRVVLEGHCDERGTVEYNMALGAERARAVKSALVSMGVTSSRIETISYGEEVPLDPAHDEDAYLKNRRVHFSPSSSGMWKGRAR